MKRTILPLILFVVVLSSCATLKNVLDMAQPLPYRLISSDQLVREAALKEFFELGAAEKKDVVLEIVRIFGREKDPVARARILTNLTDLKTGVYVIVPLILAAKENVDIKDFSPVIDFIKGMKPDPADITSLINLLSDPQWEVRLMAMTALSNLAGHAELAFPFIAESMKEFGADPAKYYEVFDNLLKINPEMAVTKLILDLKDPDSQIRRNALEKLIEMRAYLSPKLGAVKEIVPAFIRSLYSEDGELAKMAEDTLKKINDPEAKKALESYIGMGKTALKALMGFAGKQMEQLFKAQEDGLMKKLERYYDSMGYKRR
ncbi:MAG TPA: hypothetical protein ENN43_05140 [bacterium]|nr:hypothetical protein [bacterium]